VDYRRVVEDVVACAPRIQKENKYVLKKNIMRA
jgi:hypothetical protein